MGKFCPIIQKDCIEHGCKFFIHLLGNDPQNPGATIDKFDCAIAFLPILLIENANVSRQGNASMDKVATEIHKIADIPIQIRLEAPAQVPKLINGSHEGG